MTERPGRVRVIEDSQLLPQPALTLADVDTQGEAGLLGIALDPDFTQNRFVYLLYTASRPGRDPVNRIVRFLEANNTLIDAVTLLDDIPADRVHDGGRLRFGPDGFLYATMGDAAVRASAQDLGVLTGKILRIAKDGTTPMENPYASQIYSYGHRNPQGIDWHPASGDLWATEHGAIGNDELNRIQSGLNCGCRSSKGPRRWRECRRRCSSSRRRWHPQGHPFILARRSLVFRIICSLPRSAGHISVAWSSRQPIPEGS